METNTTTTSARLSILMFLAHPVHWHAYITEQTESHDDGLFFAWSFILNLKWSHLNMPDFSSRSMHHSHHSHMYENVKDSEKNVLDPSLPIDGSTPNVSGLTLDWDPSSIQGLGFVEIRSFCVILLKTQPKNPTKWTEISKNGTSLVKYQKLMSHVRFIFLYICKTQVLKKLC